MGRADDILSDVVDDGSSFFNAREVSLINLTDLGELVEKEFGQEVSRDFLNSQLNDTQPKHRDQLKKFFEGRTDMLSVSIRSRL